MNGKTIIALGIALTLMACSGFETSKARIESRAISLGTCDQRTVSSVNMCVEDIGTDYEDQGFQELLRSSCDATSGAYSTDNCERGGSVGTCIIEAGQSNETHVTYYPPKYSASSARATCEAMANSYFVGL